MPKKGNLKKAVQQLKEGNAHPVASNIKEMMFQQADILKHVKARAAVDDVATSSGLNTDDVHVRLLSLEQKLDQVLKKLSEK